jgi:hypothetical protein
MSQEANDGKYLENGASVDKNRIKSYTNIEVFRVIIGSQERPEEEGE